MGKSRFPEEQIVGVRKEAAAGRPGAALCRKHGSSAQTLYRWKAKEGGLDVRDACRVKALEDEKRRLKTLVADLPRDNQLRKAGVQRTGGHPGRTVRSWASGKPGAA